MAKPIRTFTADVGQASTGSAGPDQIEHDLDNLFAMLDPGATLRDGVTPGGIGNENMKDDSLEDGKLADLTIDQTQTASNTGKLGRLLSGIARAIRDIKGTADWKNSPAETIASLAARAPFAHASTHGPGGSDPITALLQPGAFENVKSYGAAGDGVTDDAAAVQEAIDAGSPVYFPPGTYNLGTTSLIHDDRGAVLFGAGVNQSKIVYTGPGAAVTAAGGTPETPAYNLVVRDLWIDGADTGAYGLEIGRADASPKAAAGLFENLRITGFTIAGLRCVSSQLCTFIRVECGENPGIGILLDQVPGGANTASEFIGCRAYANGQQGLYIKDAFETVRFIGFTSELNGCEGIRIDGLSRDMYNLSFDGLHMENNNQGLGRDTGCCGLFIDTGIHAVVRGTVKNAFILESPANKLLYLNSTGGSYWLENIVKGGGVSYGDIAGTPKVMSFNSGAPSDYTSVANTAAGVFLTHGANGKVNLAITKTDQGSHFLDLVGARGLIMGDRRHTFGNDYPGTGTWSKGDICFNSIPDDGETIGWVCTAGGTPGSWRPVNASYNYKALTGAAPSVWNIIQVSLTQAGPTEVANFTGGVHGQKLVVLAADGNTTIKNGASIRTNTGADIALSAGDVIEFYYDNTGGAARWVQPR